MTAPDKDLVAHLTWDAVADRIKGGAAAVLPIGAGAKEHGLHMPMNTDAIQAQWLAGVIAREVDALVWPTLSYGYYPAFVEYAGSASLQANTFQSVIRDLVSSILSFDARPVLIVNTGVSTIPPVDQVLAEKFSKHPVEHLKVYSGPGLASARAKLSEQKVSGTHADEIETSIMLALDAGRVRMDKAQASPPGKGGAPEPLSPNNPDAANYCPSGSWGDPALASADKGQILLKALAEDVAEMARHAVNKAN